MIFSPNVIQETWTLLQTKEAITRVGGAPPRARPLSCGALVAPPTSSLHPYISTYPKTSRTKIRSGVLPPEASVAMKNQSGPCFGTLPEGGSLTGGHLHIPTLSMTRRE